MVQCPRCGNLAEYVAGDVFVLVWCDLCGDLIEVGDLDLRPASSADDGVLAATRGSAAQQATGLTKLKRLREAVARRPAPPVA